MKVRITHNDIVSMVSEVMNRLGNRSMLSEIRSVDAYNRFYDGKIEPDVYKTLMSGAENMTPFHKLALDYCVNQKAGLESFGYDVMKFAKTIGNLWTSTDVEGRQFLVKACNEDTELTNSLSMFLYFLNNTSQMKSFSEKQYRNGGYEVLFENENVRVTCTKSYSSSSHYFGNSHWCTASDQFGDYDGHSMFREYTVECWDGDGILIQFCTKSESYQVQYVVKDNGEVKPYNCCNWEDYAVNVSEVENTLNEYGVSYTDIFNNYIKPNAERLADETKEFANDENIYYGRKRAIRLRRIFAGIDGGIVSKDADEFAKLAFQESQARRFEDEDKIYSAWITKYDNGFTTVGLRYNGRNESEKQIMQTYYDSCDSDFSDRFGRVPNNYSIYVFDKNGNIYKKWRGEVSTTVGKTMFITEGYNEELYDVELVAVVDTETFEEIVSRPYTFVALEDNRWFLENNMSAFLEAYNTERDDMIDESDVDTDEWFCYQPTVEYYRESKYIAINLATHEQAEFKV